MVSKLNLFSCLCFTLLNLISLTLSMKSWHSLSLCVEIIATSFDLHSSNCLEVLSKMKLIVLILAWSRSFSAFLRILLALVDFKVDFSLILTGIKSLWRHLKVNILWFLYSQALILSFSHNLNKHRVPLFHLLVVEYCVGFSYCWLNLEEQLQSLEQYIGCSWRLAFIHYCGLHQVWLEAEKLSTYIRFGSLKLLKLMVMEV